MEDITISTGDIKMDYDAVDIITATRAISIAVAGPRRGKEQIRFLSELNSELKNAAKAKNCDGVIWINYNFDWDGTTQVVTAYGTGVKIK